MNYFINDVSITNFKSIQECRIGRCKRINLFIGRPNVGKSNLIEALSLFSVPYLKESNLKKLTSFLRLQHETELFHKGDWEHDTTIYAGFGMCKVKYHLKSALLIDISIQEHSFTAAVDEKLNVKALKSDQGFNSPVKKYQYKNDVVYKRGHSKYLIPPYGSNLLSIIESYSDLKEEVTNLFKEYNLEIAFDRASQTIKILQKNKDGIFLVPYNSIADTLQRIIFYKAAIASNDNSILLFEEPEAHAFPPYMTQLTQDMIYKKSNQYFIATHSAFVLNDLLENAPDELAVYVVYYKGGETRVRRLEEKELHEAYQSGVDFFTNSESFIG